MKVYVRWMHCYNYQVEQGILSAEWKVPDPDELLNWSKEEVTKVMCLFIMEVRNANGDEYNCDTLYDLVVMVQSFFKENGVPHKFF